MEAPPDLLPEVWHPAHHHQRDLHGPGNDVGPIARKETLTAQLERLDPALPLAICEGDWWSRQHTAGSLVEKRRAAAQEDCADWRSWNLSACLAAGRN